MVIGVDVGFGRVKGYDGKFKIDFPSVIADFKPVEFETKMERREVTEKVIEYNTNKYFIGELARKQGNPRSTRDSNHIVGEEGMVLLMSTLASYYEPGTHSIKLVLGLPVKDYQKLKSDYIEAVIGPHRVVEYTPSGGRKGDYLFKIEDIDILPQPVGTLFDSLLDKKGKPENIIYATGKIGVVDLGYNTLDLVRMDELEFVGAESVSYKLGIASALEELSNSIYKSHGVEILPEKLEPHLKNGNLNIKGRSVSIAQEKREAFSKVANTVKSRISKAWSNTFELDKIIITGGGASIIGNQLAAELDHGGVEIKEDCIYTNVMGYYKRGWRKWGNE